MPYVRVLGFNSRGAELLKIAKKTAALPVITKASDIGTLDENTKRIFSLECTAGDIFALSLPDNAKQMAEKECRPIIV